MTKLCVLGAGAWGTALATCAAEKEIDVLLWDIDQQVCADINQHNNRDKLPGMSLSLRITATTDLKTALLWSPVRLLAVPVQVTRDLLHKIRLLPSNEADIWVIASKGVEQGTGLFPSELLSEILGAEQKFAILSGPSLAYEVVSQLPTRVVYAAHSEQILTMIQQFFDTAAFSGALTTDVMGTQLVGALKNVMAIVCGLIKGKKLGENMLAAFVVKAVQEMALLSTALGGNSATAYGLAGLGDLILTGYSNRSRNSRFGAELALKSAQDPINITQKSLVEGFYTAQAILQRAASIKVELPIVAYIARIMQPTGVDYELIDDLPKLLL